MRKYKERNFEDHIESYLVDINNFFSLSNEYKNNKDIYDVERCLIDQEFLEFIKTTQPDEWSKFCSQYPIEPEKKICSRLNDEIRKRGLISVLKKGFSDRGSNFDTLYFKPNSGINKLHYEKYENNKFSLIRQLYFSPYKTDLSIDMVIFINGIPFSSLELKNLQTRQDKINGEKQYKNRGINEPLLEFQRCLVHFVVGSEKISMTTNVNGENTKFFPFNKDFENPINPNGHKTSYLWEEVLTKDSILDLIKNFIFLEKEIIEKVNLKTGKLEKKQSESLIFPRFHQLRVVRNLKEKILIEGVGKDYLIQHSTGSGKSLSIGWLSHLLVTLFEENNSEKRVFDSVIVVTDRKVLDKQINKVLQQLDSRPGVVNKSTNNKKLYEFLSSGKDIIVTTVQKFPYLLSNFSGELNTNLRNKRFGVIIDEVHSSQFGESHTDLRKSLTDTSSLEGGDEFNLDNTILNEMESIQNRQNLSFFGFTGTPTNRTIQKFGTVENDNIPKVFDLYSMDQSIKEKFTLNVLLNYVTYKRYFKINENIEKELRYDKSKLVKGLINWVDLHHHSIKEKVNIILDHFLNNTVNKINGLGKGMIVTSSRLHCVKYKLEVDRQLKKRGIRIKSLVGFTGKVIDKDTNQEYTESSMNGFPDKDTETTFKKLEYRILIVNNKFQTGFDEPLLHSMYVDKILKNLQTVQTLSRLNRTFDQKENTFILDFKNDKDDVLKSYEPYFKETNLSGDTDPNIMYDLVNEILDFNIFTKDEIDETLKIIYDKNQSIELIFGKLELFIERIYELKEEDQNLFSSRCRSFVEIFSFLTQVIKFSDVSLYKLNVFLIFLIKQFKIKRPTPIPDLTDHVDLNFFRLKKDFSGEIKIGDNEIYIDPVKKKNPKPVLDEKEEYLSEIIQTLNERYNIDFTDDDIVRYDLLTKKMIKNKEFEKYYHGDNSEKDKKYIFEQKFDEVFNDFINEDFDFYKKFQKPELKKVLVSLLYKSTTKKLNKTKKNEIRNPQ